VTVRHALLPAGAVLVLGLGVYLFLEVRGAVTAEPGNQPRPPRPSPAVEARAQPPAAPPNAAAEATKHPPVGADVAQPREPAPAAQEPFSGSKLDTAMEEANKAYDRGDFEDAKQAAGRVLAQQPTNVRMLRIMVSTLCIDGDTTAAISYYAKLPSNDQEQMRTRCARYGISFGDR
jgi:hypothetical protein